MNTDMLRSHGYDTRGPGADRRDGNIPDTATRDAVADALEAARQLTGPRACARGPSAFGVPIASATRFARAGRLELGPPSAGHRAGGPTPATSHVSRIGLRRLGHAGR